MKIVHLIKLYLSIFVYSAKGHRGLGPSQTINITGQYDTTSNNKHVSAKYYHSASGGYLPPIFPQIHPHTLSLRGKISRLPGTSPFVRLYLKMKIVHSIKLYLSIFVYSAKGHGGLGPSQTINIT